MNLFIKRLALVYVMISGLVQDGVLRPGGVLKRCISVNWCSAHSQNSYRFPTELWQSLRKIFAFSLRFWIACFYSNSQSISMNKVLSYSWGDLLSIFIATVTILLLPES